MKIKFLNGDFLIEKDYVKNKNGYLTIEKDKNNIVVKELDTNIVEKEIRATKVYKKLQLLHDTHTRICAYLNRLQKESEYDKFLFKLLDRLKKQTRIQLIKEYKKKEKRVVSKINRVSKELEQVKKEILKKFNVFEKYKLSQQDSCNIIDIENACLWAVNTDFFTTSNEITINAKEREGQTIKAIIDIGTKEEVNINYEVTNNTNIVLITSFINKLNVNRNREYFFNKLLIFSEKDKKEFEAISSFYEIRKIIDKKENELSFLEKVKISLSPEPVLVENIHVKKGNVEKDHRFILTVFGKIGGYSPFYPFASFNIFSKGTKLINKKNLIRYFCWGTIWSTSLFAVVIVMFLLSLLKKIT